MTKHEQIYLMIYKMLGVAVSDHYIGDIVDNIINDVVEDVEECADPDNWNEDDVRLAIGRTLKNKLHID
jgi:hypothetical protein